MVTTNLIYRRQDGMWAVEDRNRMAVAGSPVKTEADAQRISDNHDSCGAAVRQSREVTRRELGCDYDPTD